MRPPHAAGFALKSDFVRASHGIMAQGTVVFFASPCTFFYFTSSWYFCRYASSRSLSKMRLTGSRTNANEYHPLDNF